MSSPIVQAIEAMQIERSNLVARLEKLDALIAQMRDTFHLPERSNGRRGPVPRVVAPVPLAAKPLRVVDATAGSLPTKISEVLQSLGPMAPGVLLAKARTTNYYIHKFVNMGLLVSTGKTTARLISLPSQAPSGAKEEP